MKRLVLLVSEDLDLISGISQRLDPAHYSIKCATQAQALESVMRFNPNLVLWDSAQPPIEYGFLEALRLCSQFDWLPVVLLCGSDTFKDRLKALKSGVDAYLGGPFDLEEAFAVIEALLAQADRLRQHSHQAQTPSPQASSPFVTPVACVPNAPTPSEQRVLLCVAQGRLNKEIARLLNVSLRTVESHISSMLNKTGLNNRTQLARWAIECGFHREQALSLVGH